MLAETHRAFSARTGHAILERYGMTETNMNTSNPYDGERVPGTVGFPLPGVALRMRRSRDRRGAAQRRDRHDRGEGPECVQGLLAHAGKDREPIPADGFFITGDLGTIDADGYVHIVGRGKDLIISGGFNVYPKEVESEIDALPGVDRERRHRRAAPRFRRRRRGGRDGAGPAEAEPEIIARLSSSLAKFKVPKRIFFVDELPRNAMGKVQKAELRQRYAATSPRGDMQ